MRNHVGLREITWRVEAALQLVIKCEVDVNLLVDGAIKRPHLRLPEATASARRAREDDQFRRHVLAAHGLEHIGPDFFGVVQHLGDAHLHGVFGMRNGLGGADGAITARQTGEAQTTATAVARFDTRMLWQTLDVSAATAAGEDIERIESEQQHDGADDQHGGKAHAAAAHGDLHATAAAARFAAAILDVGALLVGVVVAHGLKSAGSGGKANADLARPACAFLPDLCGISKAYGGVSRGIG
jgi:hypothetical protein